VGAVALSLFTHVLVIYVPFLQAAFHTVPLSVNDWLIATAVAATLLVIMEVAKFFTRLRNRETNALSPDGIGSPSRA
jgi:hypothetical protein